MTYARVFAVVLMSLLALGCDRPAANGKADGTDSLPKVRLALNWVPEPEFGGFYAAQQAGDYKAAHLDVEVLPAAAGAPTWQMVGAGQIEFGVSSADEVLIARTRGADVVALFAVYQTCPQGIMAHKSRGLTSLAEVFKSGTLAIEKGLPYTRWLEKKYDTFGAKMVAYSGGITEFLGDKNYAQQCFIFSEPIAAKRQGANVKTFLVADAGYNPYTGVLIARTDYVKENRTTVDAMIKSLREGWQQYLTDPKPGNDLMHSLNKTMDQQTFVEAAEAQKPLVLPEGMRPQQIGTMTLERWQTLITQLRDLGILDRDVDPKQCFLQ